MYTVCRLVSVTDGFGTRSVQLWIRSAEPPGEHRYQTWTKKLVSVEDV